MGHAKPKTVGLRRKPMAVHFVTLPKPPKPHVRPKPPPPHPVVRPKPQPVPPKPRPIVHHRPVPLPTPVKKVPPPRPKVVPRPPTPPPPPPPSPAVVAQAVDRYAVMLRTRIQQGLVVPPRVAALRLSGKAVVAFELTPAGRLLWVRIMRSSGIGAIDRAALAAVRDRSYPPFTKSMPRRPTVFRVRVGLNDGRHRF
ncbi:energy transducer TonB [Acidiferrobacter thiooxydans]|uniref:Energy transducer TonB n=2 Tax=Acidiferrobacter thiooxydans TaxID=163359 RepID=A0A368HNA0_9GAMM|nr:energy transducer TonB [Acidiferrobacter thiooxydans]